MRTFTETLDLWSMAVIVLTFVLFAVALLVKGLTQDLLLEAAVFLVSTKLILMSYKVGAVEERIQKSLAEIRDRLADLADDGTR